MYKNMYVLYYVIKEIQEKTGGEKIPNIFI